MTAGLIELAPFEDTNRRLLRNIPVSFFLPGTNTLAELWTGPSKTVAHPNPVSTDSFGNLPPIYADPGRYEFELRGLRLVTEVQLTPGSGDTRYRRRDNPVSLADLHHNPWADMSRWDDWDRPDADFVDSKRMASGGHDWVIATTVVGNRPAKIRNRKLYYEASGAGYYYTVEQPYSRLDAEFSFDAGPVANPTALAQIALVSSKKVGPAVTGAQGIATNSIHFVCNPTAWSIGIFDGVTLRNWVAQQAHVNGPLAVDRPYHVAIERLGLDRIRVHLPHGPAQDFTDAQIQAVIGQGYRIDDWWGNTAMTEHFHPAASYATDRKLAIHAFGVSGGPVMATQEILDLSRTGVRRKAGWWFANGAVPTTAAPALNILYVSPVETAENIPVDLGSMVITVASATGVFQSAIYGSNADGGPGALLWTGTFDVTAAGAPELVLPAGLVIPAGRIWSGAVATGAAPTVVVGAGTPVSGGVIPQKPSVASYMGAIYVNIGSTAAVPDPFPTTGIWHATNAPRLALRMA